MNCIRSIHRKEFLCHYLLGSALRGAARQSCVLLAGTGLLTNPILPHRTPDRHRKKALGWADILSHGLWMQSPNHTSKLTPLPSSLPVSFGPPTGWTQSEARVQGNPRKHAIKISLLGQEQSGKGREWIWRGQRKIQGTLHYLFLILLPLNWAFLCRFYHPLLSYLGVLVTCSCPTSPFSISTCEKSMRLT